MTSLARHLLALGICTTISVTNGFGQIQADDFTRSFTPGREYFFLRSGNAKLVLQADRTGMQPAFLYMLFDADRPCQTLRKERAFNYSRAKECSESTLEVVLGGIPFTALGHTTDVRWRWRDSVPAVEARWWAGGIEVNESFTALQSSNAFLREITLKGKDLAGPDTVRLRLSLPPGTFSAQGPLMVGITQSVALGIGFPGEMAATANLEKGYLESPPISVLPDAEVTVATVLISRIPAGGYAYDPECGFDQPIQARYLRGDRQGGGPEGLRAEYFNNPTFEGTPAVVRRDTNTSPYWDTGPPAEGIRADSFSVRWTGSIQAPRTGQYGFSLVADDRARLFLGDTLLLDCWENSWNVTKTAHVSLHAGRFYDLRIEFAELAGWAGMRCRWSVPAAVPDEPAVEAGVIEVFSAITGIKRSLRADATERTRTYWKQTSSIDARDPVLQTLYDNARFALPGMVGPGGLMDAGIFEYGTQWVRDGSNVAIGLIHAGHFESARALLGFILADLVTADGTTAVSGGIDAPDREEFDQMGELMYALKAYLDWTADSSLIVNSRAKLIAMIERPLEPRFRDSTHMVHNRREYWERTFDDGYELAYQTFMIRGLRDAADLSGVLGVPEKADSWREHADEFLQAMLHHPSRSLVDGGALIKRRNVDGSIADLIPGPQPAYTKDDPYTTETFHRLNPDASYALPIVLRVVDPVSELSRKTLNKLEEIWNARWSFGGYERYHSSSQQDQPGPWTFATASIARAQHDAGLHDRSRRSLEWLFQIQGGNAGAWFEEIPLIRSQMATSGIVPWTSAEVVLFMVRHWLGLSFEGSDLVLRPNLFPHNSGCAADLRFRSSRIGLEVEGPGKVRYAIVNGRKVLPRPDGSIVVPRDMMSGRIEIKVSSR